MISGFERPGIDAEEMLRWRERVASTQFRTFVEEFVPEHGVEPIDAWFVQADEAIAADLDGITIPAQEAGERFNISITQSGVGIQDGRQEMMSISIEKAKEILNEFRTT